MDMPLAEIDVVFVVELITCGAHAIAQVGREIIVLLTALTLMSFAPEARAQWLDVVATNDKPAYLLESDYYAYAETETLPLLPPPGETAQTPPAEDSQQAAQTPETSPPDPPKAKEEKKKEEIPAFAKALAPLIKDDEKITFVPGVRIQPRYNYDDNVDNNDFFINRFRLKGSGDAYGIAKYAVELKIDGTGRFEASPSAQVENAWLDFPIHKDHLYLRAGLYDIPFSRDALTSDSKLLFMDRSLIKDAITGIGEADNTIGVMLHGRPYCGHMEWDIGVFDNVFFEKVGAAGTRESDELMPAGRVAFCLLDPAKALDGYADYKASYIGEGHRLDIGLNAAHLGEAIDGLVEFNNVSAAGVDLFYNSGPYVFQTEYDWYFEDIDGAANINGEGWYAQAGYLIGELCCNPLEAAIRYQTLDPDISEKLRWTSVGLNYYIRDHNLKIQTDYTFRDGGLLDEDVFAVQLQLDF